MQIQKILPVILFATFLSSCGSDIPQNVDFNQKSLYLVLETDENGRRYINEEESACFRRRYRYGIDLIGPLSDQIEDLDVTACHKIIGSSPLNYRKKINWLESIRLEAIKYID